MKFEVTFGGRVVELETKPAMDIEDIQLVAPAHGRFIIAGRHKVDVLKGDEITVSKKDSVDFEVT